jgi:hypothetical protein
MILTEEILAPYRLKNGPVRIDGGSPLPPNFFTPTSRAFHWANLTALENPRDPKERFETVVVLAFTGSAPVLKPGREWHGLDHQCGGYSCEHQRMIATRLDPRPSVLSAMRLIAREGYGAETGHFYRSQLLASRIATYVTALQRLNLDYECSWRYLTESLYPIDATQDNLNRIAEDAPGLESVADWKDYVHVRYSSDPAIFFMTENSD